MKIPPPVVKLRTEASSVSECEVGDNKVHESSLRAIAKQSSPRYGRDCHENQRFSRNDDAIKSPRHGATKPAGAKQSCPKDGRDCRANKSTRKDAVNCQLNILATRKSAFTLAEVLITLVIIGIIAAVTVPTLMANYRKQEVSSRLKKFYSNLSQAVRLADIENQGFIKSTYSQRKEDVGSWWNKTIGIYMPVTEETIPTYTIDQSTGVITPSNVYVFNDGTIMYFRNLSSTSSISIYYDINGEKGPNSAGKDIHYFNIRQYDNSETKEHWVKVCAGPHCVGGTANSSRETLLKYCSMKAASCTVLIMKDGWQIKDDYPLGI
ncbi:MAG: type II secretion system GspH family protein [Candidatus Gastranaerophilales bacterium]|nr:type II secretion system GspH family protein [Candidatus Gastranaerophilales bacterium]